MSTVRTIQAVIPNGGTSSAAVDLGEGQLVGISLPATMTGITLSFTGSDDLNGTYQTIYYLSGVVITALTLTSSAGGKNITLPLDFLAGYRFIKIVSGSAEGAERTIQLMVKNLT